MPKYHAFNQCPNRFFVLTYQIGSKPQNDALQLESESINGSAGGLYTRTVTLTYESTGIKGRPAGFKLGNVDTSEYAVTYGYDAANGRFASISWNAGAESGVVNYSYVPNSELPAGYTSDSDIGVSYTYEARRNLKTAVENTWDASVISRYTYRFDELGRRTDVVNTGAAFAESALSIKPAIKYTIYAKNDLSVFYRYYALLKYGFLLPG